MDAFDRLEVWKRSCRLCTDVVSVVATCPEWTFRNQLTRAALSIPSNIAEGHERDSVRDFARFLRVAKGSCAELRTQLYIAAQAGLIERSAALRLADESLQITRMLQALINRISV